MAEPWLAVVFAGFYLLVLRLPASGRWHASPVLLSELHLAAAVVFLTIAIPLKASGRWLTIGWFAEGVALLWVGSRTRSSFYVAGAFLFGACAGGTGDGEPHSFKHADFQCALRDLSCRHRGLCFCGLDRTKMRRGRERCSIPVDEIAALAALIMNGLILLAAALEIHAYVVGAT